jgi:hypothetical protein
MDFYSATDPNISLGSSVCPHNKSNLGDVGDGFDSFELKKILKRVYSVEGI